MRPKSAMHFRAMILRMQEEELASRDEDKAVLAALLQQHSVLVKGGPQEAKQLLDALMVRSQSAHGERNRHASVQTRTCAT